MAFLVYRQGQQLAMMPPPTTIESNGINFGQIGGSSQNVGGGGQSSMSFLSSLAPLLMAL